MNKWLKTLVLIAISTLLFNCGGGSGSDNSVPPPNKAPTANAGSDQSIDEQTTVTLSGSGTDTDGTIASYAWKQLSGNVVTLSSSSVAKPTFTAPIAKQELTLEFELTVTDNDGATAKDTVTITVEPVNTGPQVSAGDDKSANEQTSVSLSATASDDDGEISAYSWTQVSGPSVTITNADTAMATFNAPVAKIEAQLVFAVEVTDDEGASSSSEVTVTVLPVNEISLIVKGLVTDGPIANANVVAAIGDLTFETVADQNGVYNLAIEVDEDYATDKNLVVLTATGSTGQENVKLLSVSNDFASFINLAGDDAILDSTEEFGVNITHVSSANWALSIEANGGVAPTNKEELEAIIRYVDGSELGKLAAAIKTVIDFSDTNAALALPGEVSDTWEFVTTQKVVGDYLTKVRQTQQNIDDFNQALSETFDDENVIASKGKIPSMYIRTSFSGFMSGEEFVFNIDGTGSYKELTTHADFTWKNNSNIVVDFNSAVMAVSFPSVEINGVSQQVTQQTINELIVLNVISSSEVADVVEYKKTGRYHYPNGELPDENFESEAVVTMQKKVFPFEVSELNGEFMLPVQANELTRIDQLQTANHGVIDRSYNENAFKITFSSDGTANAESAFVDSGVWNVSSSGELNILFPGYRLNVKKLDENYYVTNIYDAQQNFLGIIADEGTKREASDQWTIEKIPGKYSLDWTFTDQLYHFSVTLNSDNTGIQSSRYDSNGNGVIDSFEARDEPLEWRIENGIVAVYRYRDLQNQSCETLRDNCFIYMRREIDLFKVVGDKYFATNDFSLYAWPLFKSSLDQELRDFAFSSGISTRYWIKEPLTTNKVWNGVELNHENNSNLEEQLSVELEKEN